MVFGLKNNREKNEGGMRNQLFNSFHLFEILLHELILFSLRVSVT